MCQKLSVFDRKKRQYFYILGVRVRRALKLHKVNGLWGSGKDDWRNVSKHCLVVLARVDVLGDMSGLPGEIRSNLIIAGALHDCDKKEEIVGVNEAVGRGVPVAEAIYAVEGGGKTEKMRESGFSEQVIHLVNASGGLPETQLEVRRVLDKGEPLSSEDSAFLVMFYTDAYTRDDNWAEPVGPDEENEIDRRVVKNERYKEREKAVIAARVPNEPLFTGKTLSDVMGGLGHEIERQFVLIIAEKTGERIEPLGLPEAIDKEIERRIEIEQLP